MTPMKLKPNLIDDLSAPGELRAAGLPADVLSLFGDSAALRARLDALHFQVADSWVAGRRPDDEQLASLLGLPAADDDDAIDVDAVFEARTISFVLPADRFDPTDAASNRYASYRTGDDVVIELAEVRVSTRTDAALKPWFEMAYDFVRRDTDSVPTVGSGKTKSAFLL